MERLFALSPLPCRRRQPPIHGPSVPLHGLGAPSSSSSSASFSASLAPLLPEERLLQEYGIVEGMSAMHVGGSGAGVPGVPGSFDEASLGRSATLRLFAPPAVEQRMTPRAVATPRFLAPGEAVPQWSASPDRSLGNPEASVNGLCSGPTRVPYQDGILDHLQLPQAHLASYYYGGIHDEHSVPSFHLSRPPLQRVDRSGNFASLNQQLNSPLPMPRNSAFNGDNAWLLRSQQQQQQQQQQYEKKFYRMAKDQKRCWILQRMIETGQPPYVDVVYHVIITHVIELMVNPVANCLVQKLLDFCDEEQRLQIINQLARDPIHLIRVCLNPHGSRALQKLIETLGTVQQILSLVAALEPWFLDLIEDTHGKRIIFHCLGCLPPAYIDELIFNLANNQQGCCMLQNCLHCSTAEHQEQLAIKLSSHGNRLALDPYGNYVLQCILKLGYQSVNATLASEFGGHYVALSTQKYSSNVVEKCLRKFGERDRRQIIQELLSSQSPQFEELLQDPYANYVIKTALETTKGALRAVLVEAVRPYAFLETHPHCKRIFSLIHDI